MNLTESAISKGVIGGTGAITVVSTPSDYVSYFDRIYDVGFYISGDDITRIIAAIVSLIVAVNIIYGIIKDWRKRHKRKGSNDQSIKRSVITDPCTQMPNLLSSTRVIPEALQNKDKVNTENGKSSNGKYN